MTRLSLIALSFCAAGTLSYAVPPQTPTDPVRRVQALADAGRLDEAEREARAGGAPLAAFLGEVLALRGRMAAAESAYRAAVATGGRGQRVAQVGLAELAQRRGDDDGAFNRADSVAAAYERDRSRWSSDDRTAAGRAYLLLGTDSRWVRSALAAFDDAFAIDSSNVDAAIRVGDLFIDKYNAPDARAQFEVVLRRAPDHPRALLGLARVLDFQDSSRAMDVARRAVQANPSLTQGHILLARFHLEAEAYDSATVAARRALAIDSGAAGAWGVLGASAWITGDSTGYRRALAAAQQFNPRPASFFVEIAEAAARNRRYADAARFAQQAVAFDSTSSRALGVLGENQLRLGDIDTGRATMERAFALDPFNIWQKNTLDLLDELAKFRTVESKRFRVVAHPIDAELMATYLLPLLEEAYDTLANRYDYKPPTPIRLEVYHRHADFSVRTVGLAGLGALGVSFGTTLAMDAPAARDRGTFNWGSTAWHELAHTFTLGRSAHRVPRWLSEGLSVFEERRARPGWGADASVEFLAAYKGGHLRKVSGLSDGFVQPRYPGEVQFSYYLASLVCEMIYAERGSKAFVDILAAYGDGLETPAVFQRVLGTSMDAFDKRFDDWLKKRFETPLRYVATGEGPGDPKGAYVDAVREGISLFNDGKMDTAYEAFLRADAMYPDYSGPKGPPWWLAQVDAQRGNTTSALTRLARITLHNETAWEANELDARLRTESGDYIGAARALERMIWIWPNDIDLHVRLAETATRALDHARAVRERRAVLALGPADKLEARYQLARALAASGDIAGARREILNVLEQAPGFEKAQALLLELRGRGT
jgi:tetratricopeptide (TPR) repeat protein